MELPLFNITIIASATDNFSDDMKLGEGGFGPVYRGTLTDGKEFAVKRLPSSSGQGFNEFMNEIVMIAKLQHRNLVKILGCCVQEEETRRENAVVRIHAQQKPRQLHFCGYMVPEYAADGIFSVKSDVFSFGILVPEIISGRRNKGFYHPDHNNNLIGNAWRLWNVGRPLELTDSWLESSCNLSEVLRCVQVSLLCVQHHPEDRPSMASVVIMLGSDIALSQPKQPGMASFWKRNMKQSISL